MDTTGSRLIDPGTLAAMRELARVHADLLTLANQTQARVTQLAREASLRVGIDPDDASHGRWNVNLEKGVLEPI